MPRNINVFFLQNNSKTPIRFFLNISIFVLRLIKVRLAADFDYVFYTRIILNRAKKLQSADESCLTCGRV